MYTRTGVELIVETAKGIPASLEDNRFVKIDGSGYALDAEALSYGVSKWIDDKGENIAVVLEGVVYIEIISTSGAFTVGAAVYATTDGKAVDAGANIKGICLEAIDVTGATVAQYVKTLLIR